MLLIVVLAVLVLPPFLFLLKASIVDSHGSGEWSLANFEAGLESRRFLGSSANSRPLAAGRPPRPRATPARFPRAPKATPQPTHPPPHSATPPTPRPPPPP